MASTEASSGRVSAPADGATGGQDGRGARRALSDRLPRPWLFPLLAFTATWALIVASWNVANAIYGHGEPWTFYFLFKDAQHYLEIAQHGYPARLRFPPSAVPHGYPPQLLTTLPAGIAHPLITYKLPVPPAPYPYLPAFFPLFPALIWLLHWVAGGSFTGGAVLASVASGAAAAVMVWLLAVRVCDRWVADRAVVLLCLFPGAMVFGLLYSEPLAVAIAAATLLAMLDRRWVLAGLLGALGTAERPTLIVLTGVLGIGALVAVWQRREWRALAAAPLSLAGVAFFFSWLGTRYHKADFWFSTEKHGWGQKVDLGLNSARILTWHVHALATKSPFFNVVVIVMFAVAVLGVAAMLRARLPWPLTLFTVLTLLACVVSTAQTTKPRFVWSAFGIFIGLAAVRLPRWLFVLVALASAGLLAFLIGWWPHHYVGPAP
jgi:hypothetical protein